MKRRSGGESAFERLPTWVDVEKWPRRYLVPRLQRFRPLRGVWSRVAGAAEGWGRAGVRAASCELAAAILDPAADGAGCVTLTCSLSPRTGQGWASGERAPGEGSRHWLGAAAPPFARLGRSGSPEDAAPTRTCRSGCCCPSTLPCSAKGLVFTAELLCQVTSWQRLPRGPIGVIDCKTSPSDFEATILIDNNSRIVDGRWGTSMEISTQATSCIITVIGPAINAWIQEAARRL